MVHIDIAMILVTFIFIAMTKCHSHADEVRISMHHLNAKQVTIPLYSSFQPHRKIKTFHHNHILSKLHTVRAERLASDGVTEQQKRSHKNHQTNSNHFLRMPVPEHSLVIEDPSARRSRGHNHQNCSNCAGHHPILSKNDIHQEADTLLTKHHRTNSRHFLRMPVPEHSLVIEDPSARRSRGHHHHQNCSNCANRTAQEADTLLLSSMDGNNNNVEWFPNPEVILSADHSKICSRNCSFDDRQNSSSSNNSTSLEHAPTLDQATVVKVAVLSVLSGLGVAGNLATLVSIWSSGRQQSTMYLLLVQLAVADILVSVFCLMVDAAWKATVQWYAGDALCKAVKFMQMFALYLSTYVLVLIGFDRLCAVRFPMARLRAKYYVRNGIVFVWLFSAVLSSPQAVIFRVLRGPFVEEFHQCVTFGFYTAAWQEQFYTSLSLVMMFLLPLLVLVVTYVTTFATIANQENMFSERTSKTAMSDARHRILHKAKMKSLLITVVIVLAFVVCWTPYYATMLVFVFWEPDEELSESLQTFVFFFGSSTAIVNPVIYGAFHLRRKGGGGKRARAPKSTTLVNNSSSSRVDISMTTFHKETL